MIRWFVGALFGVSLVLGGSQNAFADQISHLANQLAKSGSAKVRISAALSLAKSDDDRALQALTRSMSSDRSPDIRRISAASLGQQLQRGVSKKQRKLVVTALTKAAKKDQDSKVRASAEVALAKGDLGASSTNSKPSKGIMVGVTAPTQISKALPRATAALLQSRVKQVISEKSPRSVQTAPGTGMPSSAQLKRSGMAGYSVVPNISSLKMKKQGRRVFVTCEIQMRLSPWGSAGDTISVDKTATVTGSGTVASGSSKKAISASSQQCIDAVVTQVTANQVVPFLVARAR